MTSTAAAAAPYEPRRSNKIQDDVTPADGDTWEEKLVVCEAAGGKLVIRSYFRNTRTRQREWDEPPSGASKIEPASPAERHDAEEELKTLQAALPAENATNNTSSNGKKKKVGFFSAFKKKDGTGGRTFFGGKKKTTDNNATAKNTTRRNQGANRDTDEDLQRAISASMGLMDQNNNENNNTTEEQEQLDMAKAISMSMMAENANNTADYDYNNSTIEEDEAERRMIEQALQASRETSTGVAMAAAHPMIDLSSNHEASVSQFDFQQPRDYDDDFFNQKMPARNNHNEKPPTSGFDPYAPQEATFLGSSSSTAAASASAAAAYPDDANEHVLRKMQEGSQRKGSRFYNKKALQEEAGVL